jgi:hypothetical protein
VTKDDNGGFHLKRHWNPQGVSGVGRETGDLYQGTGVTQFQRNATVGEEYTFVNVLNIIGQGSGNNSLLHETEHWTINANGELTTWVENYSSECQ